MLFKSKTVVAVVVIGICIASLSGVYGKPRSHIKEGDEVEIATNKPSGNRLSQLVGPSLRNSVSGQNGVSSPNRASAPNCPHLTYGCSRGNCWSQCQTQQSQSGGSGGSTTSSSSTAYSSSQSYTGCTADEQCANHYADMYNYKVSQINDKHEQLLKGWEQFGNNQNPNNYREIQNRIDNLHQQWLDNWNQVDQSNLNSWDQYPLFNQQMQTSSMGGNPGSSCVQYQTANGRGVQCSSSQVYSSGQWNNQVDSFGQELNRQIARFQNPNNFHSMSPFNG